MKTQNANETTTIKIYLLKSTSEKNDIEFFIKLRYVFQGRTLSNPTFWEFVQWIIRGGEVKHWV